MTASPGGLRNQGGGRVRLVIQWLGALPGRTGAKPTPQLPNTAVVTPCQDEGASSASQVAWPS